MSKTNTPRIVVFDIETSNTFDDVRGGNDASKLDISIVGAYDSTTDTYASYAVPELPALWSILEKADILVGYNSDHFDIPLLNKYYPGDLTLIKSLDLLVEVKNVLGRRLRLDTLAEATLGTKKSGHGLQAIQWWREGKEDLVRKYCIDDVRITKELYDYACTRKELHYIDFGEKKTIKLDTSAWHTLPEKPAMTHTLPF
jgi:DEAD/DEAH box helicase domain-containing protein